MNETVNITVPVETVKVALKAMDELPHKQVRAHIDLLVERTNASLAEQQAKQEAADAPAEQP
jgi:predicted Co/Zn/Cd cation transporter (cation efflux family)